MDLLGGVRWFGGRPTPDFDSAQSSASADVVCQIATSLNHRLRPTSRLR